jgi:glycosyltransferase involved in cell wall biosynthesis
MTADVNVVVVSSWYPSVEDPAAGRFVADQVLALEADGRVRPRVVSFDPIPLVGGQSARSDQLGAVEDLVGAAIRAGAPSFESGAAGVERDIPTARLPIADGGLPRLGTTATEAHRRHALVAFADRLVGTADGPSTRTIVHAHTGFPDGAAAAALADRLGCPLVITEHATFLERILSEPGQRASYGAACQRAARVIAVSEVLATQIREALPEISSRVVVIPNAIAVGDFRPSPPAERPPSELLFVGYRKEVKAIDVLLDAFAVVRSTRPESTLRLIGGSPDEALDSRLQAQAVRLGIADAVEFEGPAGRPEIAAAMARATAFVHASRYETFGVVAAEALASGLPVVATRSGGVEEILGPDPARLGALVDVDDPVALARAILEVLERRATFDGADLRAAVAERFGGPAVADRLVELYEGVLAEAAAIGGDGTATKLPAPEARTGDRPGPTIVIGLDRATAARRLDQLSDELRRDITLVTSRTPSSIALPSSGGLIEVDAQPHRAAADGNGQGTGLAARIARLARHPIGFVRRRILNERPIDVDTARNARLVGSALEGIAVADDTPSVAFLDGRDVLVGLGAARAARLDLLPGSVRRLADRARREPS